MLAASCPPPTGDIGLALARLRTARGERPFLHRRRAPAELDPELSPPERYVRADLADPAAPAAVARLLERAGVEGLGRRVLNAGAGWHGPGRQSRRRSGRLNATPSRSRGSGRARYAQRGIRLRTSWDGQRRRKGVASCSFDVTGIALVEGAASGARQNTD